VQLERIFPDRASVSPAEMLRELELRGRGGSGRPWVALNMVATVDGRAAIGGTSRRIGNTADRLLFHALRAETDAVLVGAATARRERYGRLVRDPETRKERVARGMAPDPLLCVVSGRLGLPPDLPALQDAEQPLLVVTESDASLPAGAGVEYLRRRPVDLAEALAHLRRERGVRFLLCEGGPRLNAHLLRLGLVDELFLSVAAKLSGGVEAPTIVTSPPFPEPLALRLEWVLEHTGDLFLRYALGSPAMPGKVQDGLHSATSDRPMG
jgi:riboflavin-specific deaminase-like protein